MATGTAPVTGTRLGTAMRSQQPPPKQSPFAKIMQQFNALPPRVKLIISVGGVLLFLGILVGMFLKDSSVPKAIFEGRRLTQEDVGEITQTLDQLNIKGYIVKSNGEAGSEILVPPDKKYYAQLELSKRGIPRPNVNPPQANGTLTSEQWSELKIKELRADIIMTLRLIDGIIDARVNLVIPKKSAFLTEKEETKAAIMLRLRPGYELRYETLSSITNLVANSVPELKADGVQIADTNGKKYYNIKPDGQVGASAGNNGPPLSGLELQAKEEVRLREKAQSMLDRALGQGRAIVQVAAELNFDQTRIQTKKVGGPTNIDGKVIKSEQIDRESYKSGDNNASGFTQVSGKFDKSKGKGYIKEKIIRNITANETTEDTVKHQGDVKRLSLSVAVDNFKPDMLASIQRIVKNAVGFRPDRGDSIAVVSFPFSATEMDGLKDQLLSNPGIETSLPVNISPAVFTKMMAIPLVLLVIVMCVFVIRAQKVDADKNKLVLATVQSTNVNDISDLLNDKAGRSTPPQTNKNNSIEQLEMLAKEKPSKVADLLKTTFLVEH